MRLLETSFVVNAPLDRAWRHLARVEDWPTWAKHIHRAVLVPPKELTARSSGTFFLDFGIRSTFVMTEFKPPTSWKWVGPFLWLTIVYDHRFEPVGTTGTRLTWTIDGRGFAVGAFGRLFALVYRRNLARAVPALIEEMRERPPS